MAVLHLECFSLLENRLNCLLVRQVAVLLELLAQLVRTREVSGPAKTEPVEIGLQKLAVQRLNAEDVGRDTVARHDVPI